MQNLGIGRLQPAIHDDSIPIVVDSSRLQADPLHIRGPPDAKQNLVDNDRVLLSMRLNGQPFSSFDLFYPQILPTTKKLNSITTHLVFDNLRGVSVLIGQNTVGRFDQIDLASKPCEGLRQLASDRPCPNDSQALGSCVRAKTLSFVR